MTETRLVEVAGHWLPRIEVAGIPSGLARAVIEAAGSWPNWCRAWSAEAARHEALADEALRLNRPVTAGAAYARAALLYHFAQFMFFDDLAQKDAASARKVAAYRKAAPLLDPPARLLSIPFEGGALKAYFRRPERFSGALALLLPGSDSTKEEFPALEAHFLQRGLATVSLDGPGQGEGRAFGGLRADITTAVQACCAHIRAELGLSGPIALVGMAFGGHLALRAAAGVPEISAVVSINGFHDLGAMWPALPPVYRDNMFYALGASDAEDARLRAAAFNLAGAPAASVPSLVLHGGQDRIFPADQAAAQAEWAGARCSATVFPSGNHVCNNIPHIYRPYVADWVRESLSTATGQPAG
jgi:2,6-dihydroxypseudooxynicotine hydrolase